jgi:hypothetical protein
MLELALLPARQTRRKSQRLDPAPDRGGMTEQPHVDDASDYLIRSLAKSAYLPKPSGDVTALHPDDILDAPHVGTALLGRAEAAHLALRPFSTP